MKQTGKTHQQSCTNTFSKKGPIKFHLVLAELHAHFTRVGRAP